MKTIQFGHQFLEALHTLYLQRVKATGVYAEMVATASSPTPMPGTGKQTASHKLEPVYALISE